ncbi:MAG TPA: ABC transporter permease [Clostridia bacterium]|nr:ABC transporter permease [Clostridia bacterium]
MKQQIELKAPKQSIDAGGVFAKIFPFLGLCLVGVFFSIMTKGMLISGKNIQRIMIQSLPMMVGTIGATFVFSQNILDMSMGSIVGLSAAMAAYASKVHPVLSIIAALFTGIIIGLANGTLHGILKINPIISTMAVSFIIRGLMQPICDYGSVGAAPEILKWNDNSIKIGATVILFLIGYILFEYTALGKKCKIVGSSETAATQSGVNVKRIKITGYLITGIAASIAGYLMLLRSGTALPATGNLFEFDVVIALVLGGMPIVGGSESRIRSAVIGTLILTVLTNGMTLWGIEEYPQQITKGLIFLIVLAISFAFKKKD